MVVGRLKGGRASVNEGLKNLPEKCDKPCGCWLAGPWNAAGGSVGDVLSYWIMEAPILFTCTGRFEERDFLFLASVIVGSEDDAAFLRFVGERDELLLVIDDERVLRAVLGSATLLNVSPWFYFYVLVRHSLLRSNLNDTAVAEYLGAMLAERVPVGPFDALKGIPSGFVHTVDFLAILDQATGDTRYELLVAAGNQFLVLTGIFPDFIRQRAERHGAPGIAYYESFARNSFQQASDCPIARRCGTSEFLDTLTQVLPVARRSLNHMADSFLFMAG